MMPRVFIVNKPLKLDRMTGYLVDAVPGLHLASEFGEVVHLLPAGELRDAPESIVTALRAGLRDFRSCDLLVCVGDPRAMAWAAAIAANLVDGELRLLHWIRASNRYQVVQASLYEKDDA